MIRNYSIVGLAFLLAGSPASATENVVNDMQKPNWSFYGDVEPTIVANDKVPGGKMLRAKITKKGANFWDSAAMSQPIKGVTKGQIVTIGFFARASSENGQAWLNANVGQIGAPYSTAVIARVTIDSDLHFYCVEGPSKIDLSDNEGKVTLHIGGDKQSIDLGPFVVTTRDETDGASQLPCDRIIKSW